MTVYMIIIRRGVVILRRIGIQTAAGRVICPVALKKEFCNA